MIIHSYCTKKSPHFVDLYKNVKRFKVFIDMIGNIYYNLYVKL